MSLLRYRFTPVPHAVRRRRTVLAATATAVVGLAALIAPAARSASGDAGPVPTAVNPETGETQAQFARRTQWWRDAKFGMFVHWGIYSVPNTDHRNTSGLGEWYLYNNEMPLPEYEKYATQFDPTGFDAKRWVAIAKAAGMKYITITSKHHDGFCMFDTKLTDYNVVKATPWHHDPMKDLAAECRRQGMKLSFYYSVKDWHHPDYLPRNAWDKRPTDGASLDRYITYLKGQVRELLTNYGPVGSIWFDGHLDHTAQEEHATEVVQMIRSLQPQTMINDRINLPEDYDTPEQVVPIDGAPHGRLWETCLTINDHWGYAWNDHNVKSRTALIQQLCDVVSKGGNLLLNVGPDAHGLIPQEEVDRLAEIGAWLKVNGASIYGTTRSPFRQLPFEGRCTQRGDRLYLQVFDWPKDGLRLNGLQTPVVSAQALATRERLTVTPDADGIVISRARSLDPAATVVVLRLAGPPRVEDQTPLQHPAADGMITLPAKDAALSGDTARIETNDDGSHLPNIGYWGSGNDAATWTAAIPAAMTYRVTLEYACPAASAGSTAVLTCDGATPAQTTFPIPSTGGWDTYQRLTLPNTIACPPGRHRIRISVGKLASPSGMMNLRRVLLTPITLPAVAGQ